VGEPAPPANGLEDQQLASLRDRATPHRPALTCKNVAGAGDENRTRTISLGIRPIHAVRAADQPGPSTASTPECPFVTVANLHVNCTTLCEPVRRKKTSRWHCYVTSCCPWQFKRPAEAPSVGDCAQASLYLVRATRSRERILIRKTSVLGVVIEAPHWTAQRVQG
jgi:hypothetical protein